MGQRQEQNFLLNLRSQQQQVHDLVGPFGGAPMLDASLQGPDLAGVILLRLLLLEPLDDNGR